VVIESGCFVGANATLLPGVRIGRGSCVAAGSVVIRDVTPETLVAGVPARPLRRLAAPPRTDSASAVAKDAGD
jgi:maltose O-acetyltransferase